MRTAVSLPNHVFEAAEKLARRLAKSRRQLYTEALMEYVTRHDPDTVTARLDEACEAIGTSEDPFVSQTTRRTLERVAW